MIKKVAFTMYPVIDLARARNFYEKPSVTRRNQIIKAKYIQKLRDIDQGI